MRTAEEVLDYLKHRLRCTVLQKKRGEGLLPSEFDTPERELKIVINYIGRKVRKTRRAEPKHEETRHGSIMIDHDEFYRAAPDGIRELKMDGRAMRIVSVEDIPQYCNLFPSGKGVLVTYE